VNRLLINHELASTEYQEKINSFFLFQKMDFFSILKSGTSFKKSQVLKPKATEAESEVVEEVDLTPITTEEEAKLFRKENSIKIYGTDVHYPIKSFQEVQLKRYLINNILKEHQSPTPIQMQSIPIMLGGRDLIACAPTGSGKTLAFSIPILHLLKNPEKGGFRALIVSPTMELAQQIARELAKLTLLKPFKTCVLTKQNVNNKAQLKQFDILISTPLRLVHAIKHESLQLSKVQHIVLDEADKLLELGFLDQVDEIFAACNNDAIQKHLFSATIPSGVEQLAQTFMLNPVRVVIGTKNAATDTIKQELLYVGQEEAKLVAVRQLVTQGLQPPILIFVQSIERAKELFHELVYDSIKVDMIHGERTVLQRENIIKNFRLGKTWVLISTELMARGIDFKGIWD
jgi:ATP-dependent RNA helicase DDX52/ROK1